MHRSLKQAFVLIGITFALLFTATFVTVRIAVAGHTPPVDSNYYEKGLKYDQTVASQREMVKMGYELHTPWLSQPTSLKPGKQNISVRFQKGKESISGAQIQLKLERSASDTFNRTLLLKEIDKGNYSGELEIPFSGSWRISISAKTKEGLLEKTKQIRIEP